MLNQLQIIGNLGKDPVLTYTPTGKSKVTFSVAVSRTVTIEGEKKEDVTWFHCVAWERTADFAVKYLAKGKKVFAQGRMSCRDWTDAQGVRKTLWELVVSQLEILSPKAAGENGNGADPVEAEVAAKSGGMSDDDFV